MKRRFDNRVGMAGCMALACLSGQVVAADAAPGGYSVWSQASHSEVADHNLVDTLTLPLRTHYEGEVNSISLGFDKKINNRLLAGVSLTQTDVSLLTPWNYGTFDSSGMTIAPYATYLLNDLFTVSGALGYGRANVDLMHNAGAPTPGTATYDTDRVYATVNLKASRWYDKLNLSAHLGYTHSSEDADGYLWSDRTIPVPADTVDFGQVDVGVRAAYLVGKVMPYLAISYGNDADITQSVSVPNRDQEGMVYTVGVNLFGAGAMSGGFYYRTVDRDKIEDDTLSANLTYRF